MHYKNSLSVGSSDMKPIKFNLHDDKEETKNETEIQDIEQVP
jgi:hypothetical protein